MIEIWIVIPHLPGKDSDRDDNARELYVSLLGQGIAPLFFTHKDTWPVRLKKKLEVIRGYSFGHFVQLEDDVRISSVFVDALRAMITAWPKEPISLAATHPLGLAVYNLGRRSYLSGKVLGWAWAAHAEDMNSLYQWAYKEKQLAKWLDQNPEAPEDYLIAWFFGNILKKQWRNPVPTIVDHRHYPTTQAAKHDWLSGMRSTVTWEHFPARSLCTPDYWRGPPVYLQPVETETIVALEGLCQWCGGNPAEITSPKTGMKICKMCGLMTARVFKDETKFPHCLTLGCENLRSGSPYANGVHAYCWECIGKFDSAALSKMMMGIT